ncbi:glycerate kinase [Robiginitalea sp. SC105]|uniref:glycerate kinase n=1 Tax=Robiginitalea sp. SC105 TaxID=2762332 RepID=UPI00163A9207|nr:glycerate kinase [Robiginitalea sp. SC105]MBC2840146.1 glycerate kinase [Robiginitalea sp. SC105]
MKLVLIPDKFKGSLSAESVCDAIAGGVRQSCPAAIFKRFAASDGGDGFLSAVRATREVATRTVATSDPLGREITAEYLYDGKSGEAFVEMALASGMVLLAESERDPLATSTRGTGRLIRAALDQGARTIYVGLGGSATTDAGMGIASEFGYEFRDSSGELLEPVGKNLERVARIIAPEQVLPEGSAVVAINDVSNPLWGEQGAAHVYAPQKGATPEAVARLDRGLRHLDRRVADELGISAGEEAGAGAAGGTAFGLQVFLGARFMGGTDFVFRLNGIRDYLKGETVDYLVTGEGRIDSQSLQGKLIQGVTDLGRRHGIPVIAVCGSCTADREALARAGLTAVIEAADPARSLEWNMANAYDLVQEAMAGYFRENPPSGS